MFTNSKSIKGVFTSNCNSKKDIIGKWLNKIEFENDIMKTGIIIHKYEIKDSYIFFVGGKYDGSSLLKIIDDNTIEGVGMFKGCAWTRE